MAVQLPPNSTGTVLDTNTVAAKDREVVNIGDPTAANTAAVQASSPARAAQRLSVGATLTNIVDPALTTANLGISGNFTSSYFAVGDGGDSFIEVAVRADVASATDGFTIQESDATADANFARTVAQVTVSANTTTFIRAQIRAANWRINFTNGGTAQTAFRVAYRTSPVPLGAFDDFHTGASIVPVELVGVALPGASGPVVGGTSTNPLRTDPTGTTAQPITDNAASLTVDNPALSVTGGGVEATAVRVTVANDSTGVLSVDDNAASLTVDQATATNLKAEVVGPTADNAANPTAKLSVLSGVALAAAPTRTEGNVNPLRLNLAGDVAVTLDSEAVTANATLSAETTKVIGTVRVQGNVGGVMDAATDAAVPANALQVGGRAAVANPTAVAAGDLVAPMCDILGKQVVRAEAPRERVVQNTITLTTTTETTLIVAGAAGVFRDLTAITIANTSATGVRVDLRDATAGTVRWSYWAPATQTVGAVLRVPAAQTTAANNWTAQLSAAVTDVRIFAQSIETV